MSEKDDVSNGSVSAKEVLRELTRERDAAEQPTYTPPHKQISGKLDLRHRTVKVAVEMQGCEFLDEVDLRYCEFEQTVNFSGCKFWKHLNSGDNVESHTVYRKDFNCSEAVFEGPFDLNGGRIEGSAYFSGTKFQHKGQSANFAWTSIEETLEFEGAIFEGPASFASLKCKGDLFCQDTIFKGGADFASLKCGGDGRFDRASFEGEEGVDFSEASLGVDLYCPDASFQGPANFRSLKCSNLTCNRVTFGGSATFSSVECSDSGHFRNVTFEEETNFAYASLDTNLSCQGATFKGPTTFNTLKCGVGGFFQRAEFQSEEETDFAYASFGTNLYCQDTTFKGQVTFYQTTIGTLVLGDSSPFAQKSLDLRECTFERFNGGLLQAKHLTGAQKPAVFSRDPYLQLEKYYQSTENEPDAKEIYYQGRLALRKRANEQNSHQVKWSFGKNICDEFLRVLTGYGVRTSRVVIAIVAVLIIGAIVFSLDEIFPVNTALAARPSGTSTASTPTMVDRLAYDVDQFIPVVSMQVKQKWEPGTQWSQAYAVVHAIAGWLLIPLFLASWSGLVRSR